MDFWRGIEDLIVLVLVVLLTSFILFSQWKKVLTRKSSGLSEGAFLCYQDSSRLNNIMFFCSFTSTVCRAHVLDDQCSLDKLSAPVSKVLRHIIDFLVRDFVNHWMKNISADTEFSNSVRSILEHIFAVICERARQVHWTRFFVMNTLQTLTHLLRIYRLTEKELLKEREDFIMLSDRERVALLSERLLSNYKLHAAIRRDPLVYLRKLSSALLSRALPSGELASDLVRPLLREIVAAKVLLPALGFVDAQYVNLALIRLLSEGQRDSEPERTSTTNSSYSNNINHASTNTNPNINVNFNGSKEDNPKISGEDGESFEKASGAVCDAPAPTLNVPASLTPPPFAPPASPLPLREREKESESEREALVGIRRFAVEEKKEKREFEREKRDGSARSFGEVLTLISSSTLIALRPERRPDPNFTHAPLPFRCWQLLSR
jgi:hypothetical protein